MNDAGDVKPTSTSNPSPIEPVYFESISIPESLIAPSGMIGREVARPSEFLKNNTLPSSSTN